MAPPTPHHIIALALGLFVFTLAGCASPEGRDTVYDIVLQGGRVIDPESGLDAVRNMGIRSGRIDAISELSPLFHGDYAVILHDGTELRMSRRYRRQVQAVLGFGF